MFLFSGLLFLNFWALAGTKHSANTKYPSFKGLVMAGYQGWFGTPRDGVLYPDEKQIRIDMRPDVSEYKKTYPKGLKMANGRPSDQYLWLTGEAGKMLLGEKPLTIKMTER